MNKKVVSGMMLTLLLTSILTLTFGIQPVKASGILYIRSDGSIDPPTASIQRDGNTYTFTDNIYDEIVVERNNIAVDGNGYNLQGSGYGIGFYLYGMSNVTIRDTEIRNFTYGVAALVSSSITISGNNAANNDYGIILYNVDCSTVSGNFAPSNYYAGIYIEASDYNTVSNNSVSSSKWFAITISDSSDYNIISNNTLLNNWGGIWGPGPEPFGEGNVILNNSISNSTQGIQLLPGPNNTLSKNTLTDTDFCFGIRGDSLSCFMQNIDTSNTVDGKPVYYLVNQRDLVIEPTAYPSVGYLAIVNSTNVTIRNLDLTKNIVAGVLLAYTNDSRIESVHIHRNSIGIALFSSNNNTITSNYIETNYEENLAAYAYGISLVDSVDNMIYHNNIVDNLLPGPWHWPGYLFVQANDANPAQNYWYHPGLLQGNYWSDYPGVDDGSGTGKHSIAGDGIGDTSISWPDTSYDDYPLISPKGSICRSFVAIKENQTYQIPILSNSSITNFSYNETLSELWFNITGTTGTVGFCNMTIPKELGDTFEVLVDGIPVSYTQTENATHYFLYFTYEHSTHIITITITPSPSALIEKLIEDVEDMNLQQGIDNSLDAKLEATLGALEALNADQRSDAGNKLNAFINEVEGQRGKKLTNEQADHLAAEAQRIIDLIRG